MLESLFKKIKKYFFNILVGLDQFVGTLFGINADETISSYVGRKYPGSYREKIINFLFNDPTHCQKSIEWGETNDTTTEYDDGCSCSCCCGKPDCDTSTY